MIKNFNLPSLLHENIAVKNLISISRKLRTVSLKVLNFREIESNSVRRRKKRLDKENSDSDSSLSEYENLVPFPKPISPIKKNW